MQRRKSGRSASRVERRTSRNCYRVGRKAGEVLPVRQPRGINRLNMHAVEGDRRRPDCRVMRSGKAEDAVRGAGMVGIAGRQSRRVLGIVQTKLESWHVIANICTNVEATNCDQQALRGDRICDDDEGQRSQEPLGLNAQSEYTAHVNGPIDPAATAFISLRQSRHYTTLSTQNPVRPERLTHRVARERHSQRHKTVGRRRKRPPPEKDSRLSIALASGKNRVRSGSIRFVSSSGHVRHSPRKPTLACVSISEARANADVRWYLSLAGGCTRPK